MFTFRGTAKHFGYSKVEGSYSSIQVEWPKLTVSSYWEIHCCSNVKLWIVYEIKDGDYGKTS